MKIKTPKLRIMKLLLRQLKITAVILLCFSFSVLNSQTMTYIDNGTYAFQSLFPDVDLHFYLYGDGYHSFIKNNTHQYGTYALPATAMLFHAKPYEAELPDEFILGDADEGESSSIYENIDFQNQVEVKRSWNLVDGQLNYFILMFENSEFPYPVSGCVEFHYNSSEIDINESEVLDNYGNSWVSEKDIANSDYPEFTDVFKWDYTNLLLGEQRFIYIPAKCLLESMSKIDTRGVMQINTCGESPEYSAKNDGSNEDVYDSQFFTLESIVSNNPHDPNYIVTDPECISSTTTNQNIDYTIIFQNEGEDPVIDAKIDLNIEGYYSNVNLISASHNCAFTWNFENSVELLLEDIYLPGLADDSTPTYEETIGWVKLSLCYTYASPAECTISNGDIFFDNEAPVPVYHELCYGNDCESLASNLECTYGEYLNGYSYYDAGNRPITSIKESELSKLKIVPSLVFNKLKIDNLQQDKFYNIKIIDGTNRIVREFANYTYSDNFINVEDLISGTYYMLINDNLKLETLRFVKL